MTRPFAIVVGVLAVLTAPVALAVDARGSICDDRARITATSNYSSGSFHGAIDSSLGGACWTRDSAAARYHRSALNQSRAWRYIGGCGASCSNNLGSSCNGGGGNMIDSDGRNGWDWRQMHINALAGHSQSKTCTRCSFGLLGSTGNSSGAHVHQENRRYGTKSTSWMSGRRVGENANCTRTLGNARME
jgi:hypothetical protein